MVKINSALVILLFSTLFNANSQDLSVGFSAPGFTNHFSVNNANNPCISPADYELIEKRCEENSRMLRQGGKPPLRTGSILFDWPLQAAPGFTDCSFYFVSAYVDQDTAGGSMLDFNCGSKTYDGHRGTDIASWPFGFYKMDNDQVEVVAGAAGTILDKHDGEFDRNCGGGNPTANYVIIEHSDGSRALYWHMKNGSITLTAIGQPVLAGDKLGVVGSSGSSSGPHLHFEVWGGATGVTRKDPFSGSCNSLNASSWWIAQKPHKETGPLRASSHTTDVVMPPCPTTDTLNEGLSFQIPFQGPGLSPGYAKFYLFMRDEVPALTANLSILDSAGTPYLSWTYQSTQSWNASYMGWSKILPVIPGTYTFQAIYNGITCSSEFEITLPAGVKYPEHDPTLILYPNPSTGNFILERGKTRIDQIDIYNLLGEKIFQSVISDQKTNIDLAVPGGIYFYRVSEKSQIICTGNLIVK